MAVSVRPLTEADIESADAILRSAFQFSDSRIADLNLYRQIEPEGLWLAELEGRPVGTVGAVNYTAFAHVGFMAVHESAQRQGVGLALMRRLLDVLERQGLPAVMLDATDAGRSLYQKFGFVDFDQSLVFTRARPPVGECPPQAQVISTGDLETLAEWDRPAFGADRRKVMRALLAAFPGRAFMVRNEAGAIGGYVFAQAGRIGPWVSRSAPAAEVLLQAALSLPFEGAVRVAAPGSNDAAGELLRRYAFELDWANRHMGKGVSEPPGRRRQIYGQTSLFLG